jgi:hypothetical protein
MKAKYSSETSVEFQRIAWCYIPEDRKLQTKDLLHLNIFLGTVSIYTVRLYSVAETTLLDNPYCPLVPHIIPKPLILYTYFLLWAWENKTGSVYKGEMLELVSLLFWTRRYLQATSGRLLPFSHARSAQEEFLEKLQSEADWETCTNLTIHKHCRLQPLWCLSLNTQHGITLDPKNKLQ